MFIWAKLLYERVDEFHSVTHSLIYLSILFIVKIVEGSNFFSSVELEMKKENFDGKQSILDPDPTTSEAGSYKYTRISNSGLGKTAKKAIKGGEGEGKGRAIKEKTSF